MNIVPKKELPVQNGGCQKMNMVLRHIRLGLVVLIWSLVRSPTTGGRRKTGNGKCLVGQEDHQGGTVKK